MTCHLCTLFHIPDCEHAEPKPKTADDVGDSIHEWTQYLADLDEERQAEERWR